MRSTWHNVPRIRGTAQAPGAGHRARDVSVVVEDAGSALTLDLAPAYPHAGVRRWWRTARLDRATGAVTVRDSWELDPGDGGPTMIHLVVAGVEGQGTGVVVAHLEQEPVGVPPRRLSTDPGEQGGGDAGTAAGRGHRDPLELGDVGDDADRGVAAGDIAGRRGGDQEQGGRDEAGHAFAQEVLRPGVRAERVVLERRHRADVVGAGEADDDGHRQDTRLGAPGAIASGRRRYIGSGSCSSASSSATARASQPALGRVGPRPCGNASG